MNQLEPIRCCYEALGQCHSPLIDQSKQGGTSTSRYPPSENFCQYCALHLVRDHSITNPLWESGLTCSITSFPSGFEFILCNDELLHCHFPPPLARIVYSYCGEGGFTHTIEDMYLAKIAHEIGTEQDKIKYHDVLHEPLLVGAFSYVHVGESTDTDGSWYLENFDGCPITLIDVLGLHGTDGYLPHEDEPVRFAKSRDGSRLLPVIEITCASWVKDDIDRRRLPETIIDQ